VLELELELAEADKFHKICNKGGPKMQDPTSCQNVTCSRDPPPQKADFHENQVDVHELQSF